jgi:hypothetical protein
MAHVTFIHGIANKPPADDLLRIWRDGLAREVEGDLGLDLGAEGITSALVYWADVLYAEPDRDIAGYEGSEEEGREAKNDEAVESEWFRPETPDQEAWLKGLAEHMKFDEPAPEGDDSFAPPEAEAGYEFERIPLPWFVKRRFMKAFLRDVHHYLFDVEHTPRPGETYRVQQEIRRRFLATLAEAEGRGRPHIVISHSMGTVIAYDCLKRVPTCPGIDGLMTLGSPLGLDEVQDKLQPGWSRDDGFPVEKVSGPWSNLFDHLDPVAGFDPFLANDYRKAGAKVVEDINEQNWGKWRHSLTKYLAGPKLRQSLRGLLEL